MQIYVKSNVAAARSPLQSCWPHTARKPSGLRGLKAGVDVEYVRTLLWDV